MEFLVNMHIHCHPEMDPAQHRDLYEREAARCRELAQQGYVKRLWRVPGRTENWGLWEAPDATALHEAIASFPLWPYMTVNVIPLAHHHNDPGIATAPENASGIQVGDGNIQSNTFGRPVGA